MGRIFFFQAEDGIRDADVTGVQTCALPISASPWPARPVPRRSAASPWRSGPRACSRTPRCPRSEEHTSELQSRPHLVCRLLLEKKNIELTGQRRTIGIVAAAQQDVRLIGDD